MKTHTQTHTPGPWKHALAFANNQPNYYAIHTGNWGQPAVAECHNECDAALIAAAPELLMALKWAVEQIADDLDPDHQAAVDECRQAIAKVEAQA